MDFDDPIYFLNRELSWLGFNNRVLEEAVDKNNPLLERLKFLAITASNLDEFFMVRVAGIKEQCASGYDKPDAAGLTPREQLRRISIMAHDMVHSQYKCWRGLLRELTKAGIMIIAPQDLTGKERQWLDGFFRDAVYPVLTPMAVDSSRPFPFLLNKSLNLAFLLLAGGGGDGSGNTAVVQVPAVLPRFVFLPGREEQRCLVLLEDIITMFSERLFPGYTIEAVAPFRITRDADLTLSEEEVHDLLAEVERSLRRRKWGDPVRLELAAAADARLAVFLQKSLALTDDDIYRSTGPLDLAAFMKLSALEGFAPLRYDPLPPQKPRDLLEEDDIFAAISRQDVLVHHPYESFQCVIDFVQRAAADPDVLAIKQTLYRVSGNSPIVAALAAAAENGKQVTVLVELKARFDEENNINWARRLEQAGCHVIYGLVGLKTHSKITLVVRREVDGIKRYVHLSTGNYNDSTARIYTDIGMFTANEQFGEDASAFFNVLSGYAQPPLWHKFSVAPLGLRQKFLELIQYEINQVKAGGSGRVIAKMNALTDTHIVKKLYEASRHGVAITLMVRGICVLKPGLPKVSENISVRSIVGRFLEHSRIYYFHHGGEEKIYLSSADWMDRNMDKRVELLFPVEEPDNVARILDILATLLADTVKARVMQPDGGYQRVNRRRRKQRDAQREFWQQAAAAVREQERQRSSELRPISRADATPPRPV